MEIEITLVGPEWERFDRIERLLWDVLYRDFGVDQQGDWLQQTPDSTYAVALTGPHALLGVARLLGSGDAPAERQLRQVAVEPLLQGQGVGRALVQACEQRAAEDGTELLWFNARDTAYGFYERLGYARVGEEFVSALTGIPHTRMEKRLR